MKIVGIITSVNKVKVKFKNIMMENASTLKITNSNFYQALKYLRK